MSIFNVTNTNDSGSGSLRQAILDTNALAGKDTINFDGVFADNIADTITLAGSSLIITDDLSINGTGADLLTISGNNASRIFDINTDATVEIQGLTVANGYAPDNDNDYYSGGGGIRNLGNLTLLHSTIKDNRTGGDGGGISNYNSLTVNNSIINSNQSENIGGGIYNTSTLTVSNSTINNNISNWSAGGIYGGYYGTIINSTITGNSAQGYGGGISYGTIINSTVSNNSAVTGGGGISFARNVISSTIVDNIGGGIFEAILVSNSTISGNSQYGIGATDRYSSIEVSNSTIIGNLGYGILSDYQTSGVTVKNSIVAGNTNNDVGGDRNFISNGYNLIGNINGNRYFSNQEQLNVPLTDVLDTTLRNNGGLVKTYALVTGSIAINAGNNADIPVKRIYLDLDGNYTTEEIPFDGRGEGFARISGGRIDIGAYEAQVNVINGTRKGDMINGTAANDIITGYQRADTLTGGAGADEFVYTSIQDAGDTITDFQTGIDKIVLNSQLFKNASPGYFNFASAISGGYLRFETQESNTVVFVDPDGSSGVGRAIKLITARNVSADELNNSGNFAFYGVPVSTFTFTVTNTNDSGAGSLRQAIQDANLSPGKNIIKFDGVFTDNVPDTITLTSGNLLIKDDLEIEGTKANLLTISGNNANRVFEINVGSIVEIKGLTIANGNVSFSLGTPFYDGAGGAILNFGTLTVSNSNITNNETGYYGTIYNAGTMTISNSSISSNRAATAGGISNSGTLTVNNSTISGNSAIDGNAGGIFNNGTLTVNNSTISGNSAYTGGDYNSSLGGGLINDFDSFAVINNTTISDNTAANGGGIYNYNSASAALIVNNSTISGNSANENGGGIKGNATVSNSIIAGNFDAPNDILGANPDVVGTFISNDHNLIGILGSSVGFNANEQLNVPITDVIDTTLKDNGGATKTHALIIGSPAINAGLNEDIPPDTADLDQDGNTTEPVPYDQRGSGFTRIVDGTVDVGAYEL